MIGRARSGSGQHLLQSRWIGAGSADGTVGRRNQSRRSLRSHEHNVVWATMSRDDTGIPSLFREMDDDRIVVVTVCKNAERTIRDCLLSVAAQSRSGVEHLVVDGGSSDGTLEIVKECSRDGLTLVRQRDRGIYDAMNQALEHVAPGSWVLFLNADDRLSDADTLGSLGKTLGPAEMLCADILWLTESGDPIRVSGGVLSVRALASRGMVVHHQGMLVRREVFDRFGRFDLSFLISADYEWVVRVVANGIRTKKLDLCLSEVRLGGASDRARGRGAFERGKVALRYFRGMNLFVAWSSVVPELVRAGLRFAAAWMGLLYLSRRLRGIQGWRTA